MAILFGANEDEAIDCLNGGMEVGTPGSDYDPNYCRGAIRVHGNPGAQLRFSGALKAYLDAQPEDDKDFWFAYRMRGDGGFLGGQMGLQLFDTNGVAAKVYARLRGAGVGDLMLETSTDGASFTPYPASIFTQPNPHKQFSFRIKIHPTLGGITWYIDNALWFQTVPGDTTGWVVGSPSKVWWSCPNSNDRCFITEVMASTADHPLPGLRLKSLPYTAVGALAGWNGAVTTVNELVKDVASAQTTAAAATDESFVFDAIPALADGIVVHALIVSAEARTAPVPAPQHMIGGLRIGILVYPAAMQLVQAVAGMLQFIFHTNPAAAPGTPFTVADVNALQSVHRSAA